MKYILVIGDGMADNPVEKLGNKTPLQYVNIPTIDRLACEGELGNTLNVPVGLPAGSDTAILSIFGCDPRVCYTGRAPLEAAASGISLRAGDVAYRCNMVAFEDNDVAYEKRKILSHSAGSIDGKTSDELVTYLFNHPDFKPMADAAGFTVYPSSSYRHIAIQRGFDATNISLKPPHDHLGEEVGANLPSGCENAETLKRLMKKAFEVLNDCEINKKRRADGKLAANGIWFWAEGTAVELPNFVDHYGHSGGVISAVPLCHGIANLIGLKMIKVEGATGELDTNLEAKVDAAIKVLEKDDFVAVHFEAPDECTHNGDTEGKLQAISWLDSRVVKPLTEKLNGLGYDYRILILSDHKTLTSTKSHDGDPVPYIIYDSRVKKGSGMTYSEENGLKGVKVDAGVELMGKLFQQK